MYYSFYIFVVHFGQSDKNSYFGYFDKNMFMRFRFDDSSSWDVVLVVVREGGRVKMCIV